MMINLPLCRAVRLAIFLFLFVLLLSASAFARSEISGKVVKVADGDTITVLAPGNHQIKVRLYGIDCPEKKQAFGQRARQFTAQRVAGKNVRVEIMDHDRYGRTVGVVYAENGQNVNREILSAGMAWVYTQFCKASFCSEWKSVEQKAKRAGAGLWVEKNPLPPWEWRKMRRGR